MTRPGGRGLAALALAALLGVSGGAVTAFFAQDDEPPGSDPLGLGVPLENVACGSEIIMIVGFGNTRGGLAPAVTDYDEDGVKYLETDQSCDTAYPLRGGEVQQYAAYLTYPTVESACAERMTTLHKNDFVTRMRSGNEDPVMCPCELDRTTLPEIGEGFDETTKSRMWTSQYQIMLAQMGRLDTVGLDLGTFGQETIDATRRLQGNNNLNPYGYVDQDTWAVLRDKACELFRN